MRRAGYSNKRGRRRRRRSFRLIVSFICFVMILCALSSAAVIFFKIGEIRVVGETRYSDEQIIQASNIKKGQSMFLFNKFASISSIFSSCPYIDEIQMRRSLPDAIEIIVTPCEPALEVVCPDGRYIMDLKGKILERRAAASDGGLTVVTGGELLEPEVGNYAVFSQEESSKALFSVLNTAKNSDILKNIGEVDISKAYDISFKYMDRFRVRIGEADDIEHKFKFMQAVIDSLSGNETGVIDVSDGETGYFTIDSNIG